jgi:hypothetical protein
MKVKVALLCVVGVVFAAVVVGFLAEPANGRLLSDAEMRGIIGRIGDGCPCYDASDVIDCNKMSECNTCYEKEGDWPTETCSGAGKDYLGLILPVCHGQNPNSKTCHDGTPELCYKTYAITLVGYYNNKRCMQAAPLSKSCVIGIGYDGWNCRQCCCSGEGIPHSETPQTCTEE